ncbi:MAG: alkaline phosphatase family protein [Acidobacteria bacterium]|nr:alkaline phosphatase family protein [Acidobacteriota bacterium]
MRGTRAALLLLLASLLPAVSLAQRPAPPARHVVLISIDGLRPDYYLPSASRLTKTPVLDALRARGSWAEGVVGVFPSLTYPSHTSIVTGVRPALHGVVQNTAFAPGGGGSWFFESSVLKVPTLWDTAREAGLTTAGISWPVTVGAPIDYLLPETNQAPRDSTWLDLMRRQSTPGLVDAVVERLGGFEPDANRDYVQRDRFSTAAASVIIERHRPNLLLIHLVEADTAQHQRGPNSPQAVAAMARIDASIGTILQSIEAAGMTASTAVVITGDHGFYRVHSAFQPNVVLREAGLIEVDGAGAVTSWQAMAHRAAIRLKDPSDAALAARVEQLFGDLADGRYKGLFRVVARDEIAARGGDPEALLFLEPSEGYTTAAGMTGEFLVSSARHGDHGYTPDAPAMHTGLIAAGAGIQRGIGMPLARQIDIGPTVARLLGLTLPRAEGVAMVGLLERQK